MVSPLGKDSVTLEEEGLFPIPTEISLCMLWCVGSGIMVRAHMGITVENGISAGLALKEVNPVNSTEPHPTRMPLAVISVGNSSYPSDNGVFKWELTDFIKAHETVRASGRFNFEECRIPIPTAVRYDRIREFLGGDASPKELRVISMLRYGMPINCNPAFGFRKLQKNHFSAVNYRQAIDDYVARSVQNLAILGPFKVALIVDLCFILGKRCSVTTASN